MTSIRDILDSTLPLGFSYFYGLEDDEGYLRRILHTNPSLELIYSTLRDDLQFISEVDGDYFKNRKQLKNFKKLKKYLLIAKKYIAGQLKKKKKGSKAEMEDIEKEIHELGKEFREGLIEKEDYDYAVRILLKPKADNLDEIKTKFDEIDRRVKRQLKKIGYEEQDLEFYDAENEEEEYRESVDINKLVDENNRRYTIEEFNDLYEAILPGQQNPAAANDPVTRKNNMTQQKLRQDRIKNLIAKKKLPKTVNSAQLAKMTDDQIAALENS
jgi:hypothetical protein